jgi:nucleotide-binding universal stress UspA family protein
MTETANVSLQDKTRKGQPVLVAIDFSEDSRAALLWAGEYARRIEAALILLHVVHDPASYPGFYRKEQKEELVPMQQIAEEMMVDFLSEMKQEYSGLDWLDLARTELISGMPPGRIVEMAELLGAGTIVIGSRGLTGLPHMLLGSVAERVVELASIPVVVVKADSKVDDSG